MKYLVHPIHRVAPRDSDKIAVELPDNCFSDSRTLGKALRDAKILAPGQRIRDFRITGDRLVAFPTYGTWHSVIIDMSGVPKTVKAEFCITYETITPESAEDGDNADHGWWMPGGWKYSLKHNHAAVLAEARAGEYDFDRLRYALKSALSLGVYEGQREANGLSVRSVDPDCDYQSGEDTYYTLHVKGVTKSTRDRIVSYLESKGAKFFS